jgi:hypothetical protein
MGDRWNNMKSAFIQLFLILVLFSCDNNEAVDSNLDSETEISIDTTETFSEVSNFQEPQLTITYLEGDVFISKDGGDWELADFGNSLALNDRIKTDADSICELQFTDLAAVKIDELTEIKVSSIARNNGRNTIQLDSGSIVSRVRSLSGNENFNIRTTSATAGVRGTVFSVSSNETGETTIAVAEGTVAVVPTSLVLEESDEKTLEVFSKLEEKAALITAGKEVSLDSEDAAVIDSIIETAVVNEAAVEEVIEDLQIIPTEQIVNFSSESEELLSRFEDLELPDSSLESDTSSEQENVSLEQRPPGLSLSVKPSNASIYVNSQLLGSGDLDRDFPLDESLEILITHPGYIPQLLDFKIGEDRVISNINLDRRTVGALESLSSSSIIGFNSDARNFYAIDGAGTLRAFTRNLVPQWAQNTGNTSVGLGFPVIIGNTAYFSGRSSFSSFDKNTGTPRFSNELSSSGAHVFGRHLIQAGEFLVYPETEQLTIISQDGTPIRSISIPENSRMNPGVWNGKLVIVNSNGTLFLMDPASGTTLYSMQTSLGQIIGTSPVISGNNAFLGDRQGQIVKIDLQREQEMAVIRIPQENSQLIHTMSIQAGKLYAFSRGTVFTFSLSNLSLVTDPLDGVLFPPTFNQNRMVLAFADNTIKVYQIEPWLLIEEIEMVGELSTAPFVKDNSLLLGYADGRVQRLQLGY